mgnify:CR=1 FL=1
MIYRLLALVLGVLLGIWAFIIAETIKERLIILILMLFIFFLPKLLPLRLSFISFGAWLLFGMGCYLFIKWQEGKR